MLTRLIIRNYAIIPELDLSFQPGLSVITGETGAGKSILLGALGLALGKRADSAGFQSDLEAAMLHFGNALAKGPTDLFQDLLRELRQSPDFSRHTNLVASTLAVSLGAVESPALADRLTGLEPDAFAVASDAAKAGKRKLLDQIDRRAADWPKDAKAKWSFLREAVRPRGRFGRDVACFAIGVVAMGLAWAVVRFTS